jgi:hypothetical protein
MKAFKMLEMGLNCGCAGSAVFISSRVHGLTGRPIADRCLNASASPLLDSITKEYALKILEKAPHVFFATNYR